jgi:hypothetical protein
LQFDDVPAGEATLVAERDGFAPFEVKLDLAPDSELTYAIELVQQIGTIVIAPADGVQVTVVDARGDVIAKGTTNASSALRLPVRVGQQHELRAIKDGCEPFSLRVDIASGKDLAVELELTRLRRVVKFKVGALLDGAIESKDASGTWKQVEGRNGKVTGDAGEPSRPVYLEPGSYRIHWEQDGAPRSKEFEVPLAAGAASEAFMVSLD